MKETVREALKERAGESVEVVTRRGEQPFLESWYELADESHVWFRWRMKAAHNQLRRAGVPLEQSLRALEVGCGTGVLRSQFEAATRWTVDGADLDYNALCRAGAGRGRTLYYDIRDEAAELVEAYDVLILYDVLEHIEDARPFVASLLRHLKPGGLLLVNVPAVPSLYGDYDRAAGHFRRYDKAGLGREFEGFGVEMIDTRYWGFGLLPLLVLRELMLRFGRRGSSEEVVRRGFESPHPLFDKLLGALMRVESRVLRNPPLGSSLLMVGRKGVAPGSV